MFCRAMECAWRHFRLPERLHQALGPDESWRRSATGVAWTRGRIKQLTLPLHVNGSHAWCAACTGGSAVRPGAPISCELTSTAVDDELAVLKTEEEEDDDPGEEDPEEERHKAEIEKEINR